MTERIDRGGDVMPRREGALERCVGDPEAFAVRIWGRHPMVRQGEGDFSDLLTLGDVDRMITGMSLRLPLFRLVRDGATLPPEAYTKSGRTGSTAMTGIADPAKILALFRDGATIVLQGLHRYWEPLARFGRAIELALGHPAQVNAYVTPPGSRGLAVHEDGHDVFVLQAFGGKHWEVWEAPNSRPGRPNGDRGEPALSVQLAPGDCLYMPKGTPHAARTERTVSGHLTVGIQAATWGDILGDALSAIRREGALGDPLPVAYHRDPKAFARGVGERIEELQRRLDKMDASDVAEARVRSFLTGRQPVLGGALRDLVRVESVDDATRVRRREGSVCEVRIRGDRLTLYLGDRELDMPGWVEPAMRFVAGAETFSVRDLAPWIEREESRTVLIRRLVREGLLGLADGG